MLNRKTIVKSKDWEFMRCNPESLLVLQRHQEGLRIQLTIRLNKINVNS